MSNQRVLHMLHALEVAPGECGATVRKGDKWADSLGQTLALCVCTHRQTDTYICPWSDVQGHGFVFDIWQGPFKSVPARYLEFEHEIASRHYQGLLTSMRKAYGADFSETDQVTIVAYRRLD